MSYCGPSIALQQIKPSQLHSGVSRSPPMSKNKQIENLVTIIKRLHKKQFPSFGTVPEMREAGNWAKHTSMSQANARNYERRVKTHRVLAGGAKIGSRSNHELAACDSLHPGQGADGTAKDASRQPNWAVVPVNYDSPVSDSLTGYRSYSNNFSKVKLMSKRKSNFNQLRSSKMEIKAKCNSISAQRREELSPSGINNSKNSRRSITQELAGVGHIHSPRQHVNLALPAGLTSPSNKCNKYTKYCQNMYDRKQSGTLSRSKNFFGRKRSKRNLSEISQELGTQTTSRPNFQKMAKIKSELTTIPSHKDLDLQQRLSNIKYNRIKLKNKLKTEEAPPIEQVCPELYSSRNLSTRQLNLNHIKSKPLLNHRSFKSSYQTKLEARNLYKKWSGKRSTEPHEHQLSGWNDLTSPHEHLCEEFPLVAG